jgi:aminopeptidase YwaD
MTDIDVHRLQAHLERIVRPRPPGSAELESLRVYVTEQLRQAGWSVRRHEFATASETGVPLAGINLVATLPPLAPPSEGGERRHPLAPASEGGKRKQAEGGENRRVEARERTYLCVAAHLDSRPETPGADDNASGVAGLLEIARCWPEWRRERGAELELLVTDLEEWGMLGGVEHARLWRTREQHTSARERLAGMVSLEMIAYCDQRPNSQALPRMLIGKYPTTGNFIAVIGNQNSEQLIELFEDGFKDIAGLSVETLQVPDNGNLLQATRLSDHSPFWDAGFSAVMITDTSFLRNPHYHQASDTLETLDLHFLTQVTAGSLRAIRRAVSALA